MGASVEKPLWIQQFCIRKRLFDVSGRHRRRFVLQPCCGTDREGAREGVHIIHTAGRHPGERHGTPMQRPGQPEELAPTCVYLASPDSS
ncbi:hypothetical protein DOE73_09220 [Paenibacillus dendritiformis]|nr:hypothetical protein DOE73_09220 [Paenibacillus dendritiformis]